METNEKFFEAAIKEFGEKINVMVLDISQEQIDAVNKDRGCHITKEDFVKYGKQAWLMGSKCPVCGADLLGLFGSFEWGIVHGIGECSNCRKVSLRYYHYIGESKQPICGFTIIGF